MAFDYNEKHTQKNIIKLLKVVSLSTGGLDRLAAWHLPGGPVGHPARWAATSNVEVG